MAAERKFLHIAVGVLRNARGEVLVCQRPAHKLYPGEWEFPGGKVEPGESCADALARELHEELGIAVRIARPLIRVRHVYPELSVELETWEVNGFDGEPVSTEHPATAWVLPDQLPRWPLLAADRPIVNALRLPGHLVFTPPDMDAQALRAGLAGLPRGALLRLRLPELGDAEYAALARELAPRCAAHGLALVVDRANAATADVRGRHASARAAASLTARPVPQEAWFGVSCHDASELDTAVRLGADYAVLGPVCPTPTHAGAPSLGWERFGELVRGAGIPVYAIGGVGPEDLETARRHGAQGVAGISAYWRVRGSVEVSAGGASASSSAGIE